ncbi:MAG: hypothetical protein ACLPRE_01520 [Limisphaerales bacterium]
MNKISIILETAEKAMTAETDRAEQLLARAEKLAAGIVIVIGFQLWNLTGMLDPSSRWVNGSCYLSLGALSLSLLFAFYSMGLKGYAGYPRGDKLWETLKSENVSDADAEQAVIQLLLRNREQNARLNDAKMGLLFWCGSLFFVGFLLVIISHLLAALANNYGNPAL